MILFMFCKIPYLCTYMYISVRGYFWGREKIKGVIFQRDSDVFDFIH